MGPKGVKMSAALLDQFARRADHVVWKVVGNKGILLNLENGAYFETGQVGLAIWKGCSGKKSLRNVSRTLHREFGAAPERIEKDLVQFVRELKRLKLAEVSERTQAGGRGSLS